MADVGAPLRKELEQMRRLTETIDLGRQNQLDAIRRLTESMPKFRIPDFELPVSPSKPMISERDPVFVPRAPRQKPKSGPAVQAIKVILDAFEAERAAKEDQRHAVIMVATISDGEQLLVERLSSHGDHVIPIDGRSWTTCKNRSALVGVEAFVIRFETIDLPPKKPTLRVVI